MMKVIIVKEDGCSISKDILDLSISGDVDLTTTKYYIDVLFDNIKDPNDIYCFVKWGQGFTMAICEDNLSVIRRVYYNSHLQKIHNESITIVSFNNDNTIQYMEYAKSLIDNHINVLNRDKKLEILLKD